MGLRIWGMPDHGVVEIGVPHLFRRVDHPSGLQIRADLDDASAFQREVGLPLALRQIHRESAMRAFENGLCFRGKMIGLIEYLELHLALPADHSVFIRTDVADREQGGEQRADGASLHVLLSNAINYLCRNPNANSERHPLLD